MQGEEYVVKKRGWRMGRQLCFASCQPQNATNVAQVLGGRKGRMDEEQILELNKDWMVDDRFRSTS